MTSARVLLRAGRRWTAPAPPAGSSLTRIACRVVTCEKNKTPSVEAVKAQQAGAPPVTTVQLQPRQQGCQCSKAGLQRTTTYGHKRVGGYGGNNACGA
jgi:hypothetical protein